MAYERLNLTNHVDKWTSANVQHLEDGFLAIAQESTEYPGCFYRIVDGETEWLNPPNVFDVIYRTTERYGGKPVYTVTTKFDALKNRTSMESTDNYVAKTISTDFYPNVIYVTGRAYSSTATGCFPLPMTDWVGETMLTVHCNSNSSSLVPVISTHVLSDMSNYRAEVMIKFTPL